MTRARTRTRRPARRRPARRRPIRTVVIASLTVTAVGAGGAAWALWSTAGRLDPAPVQVGSVGLAAAELSTTPSVETSVDGAPVTVTLPGPDVVGVLTQDTVIWQFTVTGFAQGATGMTYSITVPEPADGTIRSFSTTTVYPATLSGDCSTVPADQPDLTDRVLVAPATGAETAGAPATQVWCVAVDWINDPDGTYANDAYVTATALDGSQVAAVDTFDAAVHFPPSLRAMGDYVNRASVSALALDGSTARADSLWSGVVYPDPSGEPGLTLTIDPTVTHANPAVVPGDHTAL